MKSFQIVSLFLVVAVFLVIFDAGAAAKIAIIGGGIGGAASAYYLRKLAPPETEIHLFNIGDIGGRLTTIQMQFNGKTRRFEAGGTVLHPANAYFNHWLEEFGLSKKEASDDSKGIMGLWNGDEFVFMNSPWYLVTLFRLITRYGFDPLKVRSGSGSFLSDFENIYEQFHKRQSFDTIDDMAMGMSPGLASMLNKTTREYLIENGYHDPYIKEFVTGILSFSYMQSVEELHALVGFFGLTFGMPGLYSVHGSNKLVVEKLIDYAKPKLISAEVAVVSKRDDHFVLLGNNGQELGADYDYVIVAVPIHQEQRLQIHGVNLDDQRGVYKILVATFVQGSLNTTYFSGPDSEMLSTVFVCSSEEPYRALGQLSPVDYKKGEPLPTSGPDRVWKLFSTKELTKSQLAQYFDEIKDVKKKVFVAYPDYAQPPPGRPRFRLAKGICAANAVEWLAGSIETSAMGGVNCANMALNDLGLLEGGATTKSEL